MLEYMEGNDVARELRISASTVRQLASLGRLPVAAKTRRGVRLYLAHDVAKVARRREGGE